MQNTENAANSENVVTPKTSKIQSMIQLCRNYSENSATSIRKNDSEFLEEFVPLPDLDPDEFFIDVNGSRDCSSANANPNPQSFECPPKLEDMLYIVRQLREQRIAQMHPTLFHTFPTIEEADETPVSEANQATPQTERPRKRRRNDYSLNAISSALSKE